MNITEDNLHHDRTDLELTLKRENYKSSSEIAIRTLNLLEKYVQSYIWKSAKDLIRWLKETNEILGKAAVSETAASNIILRVIKTVKDDFITATNKSEDSLTSGGTGSSTFGQADFEDSIDFSLEVPSLRSDVQNAIWELLAELENSSINIAEEAEKHIHSNEVVLTLGRSRTVETFLKKAAKKRTFEVIVSECAPFNHGHQLAESLSKSKIQTTLILDTAIFAMMSRVNKVIIGAHNVLANGGLKAIAGSHLISLAAKYYNVPVIVLAPVYKLSPKYPLCADVKISNRFISPESLIDYSEGSLITKVQIYNPIFDYVPPELISLFIFNIGSHAPSYMYRLLHETYGDIINLDN